MAVKIEGTQQSQQNNSGSFQQQRSDRAMLGAQPSFGISTKLSVYGSGGEMYENLFSEITKKIKFLNEELKTEEKYYAFKLLKHNAGLNYSGIIVAEAINDFVAAHILIVEKTGDYPEKLVENIAGVRYEIIRTPADALDEKYVLQAQNLVAESMKISPNDVVIVDGTLVPNEFDVTNEVLLNDLINNTFSAIHSETSTRVLDYKGISIGNIVNKYKNGKFCVNLYFNTENNNFVNQVNMPIRQDICISLSYKMNTSGNNKSVNQGTDTYDIVKTYGYIDFEWSPVVVNNMMSSQKFVPNFIITHIDASVAPTPDILMLGIASVFAINEDMNWMQAFRPVPGKKSEIDFNDIGALNIEGNIENSTTGFGKKYDTKSKTFSVVELNKFIQTLVRPNLMISIDVPKAGPETWYTSILQYIKFRNSAEAMKRVNDYISVLTDRAFDNKAPMFTDISNKIHSGYYKTKDGYKDIRHLNSYLGVSNFIADTNQQPALIAQYTNTLYNTSIPAELRSAERKKYIDEMSNGSAVYKQFYDRLTFNAVFLMNLVNSLKISGFNPVFTNMGAINDIFQRRSSGDFNSAMLGSDARILGQQNGYNAWLGMPYYYNRSF